MSDKELVDATLENPDCYAYIIDKYQTPLKSYIYRISGFCYADIADILQDTFIKAYRHLNNWDSSMTLSTWLYRIAHNTVIDTHRRIKVRPSTTSIDSDEQDDKKALVDMLASDENIEKAYESKDISLYINIAMQSLPLIYREALYLRYMQDLDYSEIADIVRCPVGTVSTRIAKAKKLLKNALIAYDTPNTQ